MTNKPGPQRALGSRGQTINAEAWPYFDGLIRAVSARTGASYDDLVVEATRPRSRQAYLYDGYRLGRIDPATSRRFNPAYPPDSPLAFHVAGDAVDFGAGAGTRGSRVQVALHQLGPAFGIFFEVVNELWHGRFDRTRAPKITTASIESETMPTAKEIASALLNHPAYDGGPTVSVVLRSTHMGLWTGGDSTGPHKLPLAQQISETREAVTATVTRDSKATGTRVGAAPVKLTQIQDAADTNSIVRVILDRLDTIAPPVKK